MSTFANLVGAVAVVLRDPHALGGSTATEALLRVLARGPREVEQNALAVAVDCLERRTRLLLDDVPPARTIAAIDEHVAVPALISVDTSSAIAWLRAFDENVAKNCAGLGRALSFAQNVTLPHVVTTALTRARAGNLKPASTPTQVAAPDGSLAWQVTPSSSDVVLVVPVADVEEGPFVGVRKTLSGSVLRTWWATWELALAEKSREGFFHVDMRHVILDLFGAKPEVETKNGRRYQRPPRGFEKQVDRALDVLERTFVGGIGDVTVENPEPLIHRYGDVRRNGRIVRHRQYAHARLVWAARRTSFIQLPRAAFRLDADDAPLAMGIAALLRVRARDWLAGGALTMNLVEVAHAVGDDVAAGLRRAGRTYWSELRHRLERVVPAGGFGAIGFHGGVDGSTRSTIELWPPLAAAYSGLARGREPALLAQ